MNGLSTHILDVSRGLPAAGIPVRLEQSLDDGWHETARATTDADGRARLCEGELEAGTYRLTFEVAAYFEATGALAFFPVVQITFCVRDARHHHVPLLLSPFGFSTYRGS